MDLTLNATPVFEKNHRSTARITVNRGGTRSSKTYSLAQLFVVKAFQETGEVFTICRKTLPALKATAYRDFLEVLKVSGIYNEAHHNKSELTYHLNGNEIEFISVDQPQKIRGRKRKHLWMNEANEFDYDDFQQLILRTTGQVYMDLNPSDYHHWIREKVETRPDVLLIHSTYKDNPFLEPETVKEIERLQEADPNYWRIYGLGEYGVPQTLIYTHYKLIDDLPGRGDTIYGLDFGFNHPLVMQKVELYEEAVYVDERIHQRFLETPDAIKLVKEEAGQSLIYADSEDPREIQEYSSAGLRVQKAVKGPESVYLGIQLLKSKPLYITKRSVNTIKEIHGYSWKVDKNGDPLDEPVKIRDDAMDAMRYAVYSYNQMPFVGFA